MGNVSWIGQTLGERYQIQELLGQGGMSSVYKALDPNLKRVVAVKMVHPHLSSNPEFVRRFEEEAAVVAKFRNDNIVQVFDFNHDGDTYYMVLEFVPGESLQDRLKRLNDKGRRLPLPEALNYLAQIADALEYAHKRGMIHRDIKPANIMLDVHGRAILMDFGIAKMMGGVGHTATDAVVGTAKYMSPEQIQDEQLDERSDLYSLGVTLFEAVSGQPPYQADSAITLLMMHINDPVPDIRELAPDAPAELAELIARALEKDRQHRFASAAEMAAALREVKAIAEGKPVVKASGRQEPAGRQDQQRAQHEQQEQREQTPGGAARGAGPAQGAGGGAPPTGGWSGAGQQPQRGQRTLQEQQNQRANQQSDPVPATGGAGGAVPDPTPDPFPKKRKGLQPTTMTLMAVGALAVVATMGGFLLFAFNLFRPIIAPDPTTDPQTLTEVALFVTQAAGIQAATQTALAAPPTPTKTPAPSKTPWSKPTELIAVPEPQSQSPIQQPLETATPTVPPNTYYVRINHIGVSGNAYVVDYETFLYTEVLPGMHVHFFYDTVHPDQAGVPGNGPWILYGGPRPFTKYTLDSRPKGATQMCALVANADHSVQANSGNCYPLP